MDNRSLCVGGRGHFVWKGMLCDRLMLFVLEDDSGQEIQYMLDAQAEFMKEVILMAFRNMLSS